MDNHDFICGELGITEAKGREKDLLKKPTNILKTDRLGKRLRKTLEISSYTQVQVNLGRVRGQDFSENKREKCFLLKQFAIPTHPANEAGLSLSGAHVDITFFSLIS